MAEALYRGDLSMPWAAFDWVISIAIIGMAVVAAALIEWMTDLD